MLELDREWSYGDLVDWHSITNAIESATEAARRSADAEAEAHRSVGGVR